MIFIFIIVSISYCYVDFVTCCLQPYDDQLYHTASHHASFHESCEVLYPHCRDRYKVPYETRYTNTLIQLGNIPIFKLY